MPWRGLGEREEATGHAMAVIALWRGRTHAECRGDANRSGSRETWLQHPKVPFPTREPDFAASKGNAVTPAAPGAASHVPCPPHAVHGAGLLCPQLCCWTSPSQVPRGGRRPCCTCQSLLPLLIGALCSCHHRCCQGIMMPFAGVVNEYSRPWIRLTMWHSTC